MSSRTWKINNNHSQPTSATWLIFREADSGVLKGVILDVLNSTGAKKPKAIENIPVVGKVEV